MKKSAYIFFGCIAAVFLLPFVWMYFGPYFGLKPVEESVALGNVEDYLVETYPQHDLTIESSWYNSQTYQYWVEVYSNNSIDTHFRVYTDRKGTVTGDEYVNVTNGWNTFIRIENAYIEYSFEHLAEEWPVELHFEPSGWLEPGLESQRIDFRDIGLEVDMDYDLMEMGRLYGGLEFYVYSDEISYEAMAEILLKLNNELERREFPYYCMELTIVPPKDQWVEGDMGMQERLSIRGIPYTEIYEENLAERLREWE